MFRPKQLRPLGTYLLLVILLPLLELPPFQYRAPLEIRAAVEALHRGTYLEAAAHFAAAAERQPRRGDLWEAAGIYALQGGDPQRSEIYLERAALMQPSTNILIQLGDARKQQGDAYGAIEAWEQALQTGKVPSGLYWDLASAYLEQQDLASAARVLKMLAEREPGQAEVQFHLGMVSAAYEPEAALAYLSHAARLDPGLKDAVSRITRSITAARFADDPAYSLVSAGRALAGLGEWDLAAAAFHRAVQIRPDYAEAWAFLGEARQQAGMDGLAEVDSLQALQTAVELDPGSLSAQLFLAMYWQRQGEPEKAVQSLQAALQHNPERAILLAELGNALAAQGDLAAAYEAYQQAARQAPQNPSYFRLLAAFSLKYNYQPGVVALPAARRAVLLNTQDPQSLDMMAQVLIRLNDLCNAGRFARRALQVDPSYAPAHLHLGLIYRLQGQEQLAQQAFELARSLDKGGPTAEQAERLLQ